MNWFLRRSFRDKLLIVFSAIVLLVLVQSYKTLSAVRSDQQAFSAVNDTEVIIAQGNDAFGALASLQSNYRGFLVTGDETFVDRTKDDEAAYRRNVGLLVGNSDPATADRWRKVDAATTTWLDQSVHPGVDLRRKVNEGTADQSEVSAFISTGAGQAQFDAVSTAVDQADNAANAELRRRATESQESSTNVQWLIFALSMAVVGLCLLAVFVLRRAVARPLDLAAEKARAIAEGDVDIEPFPERLDVGFLSVPIEGSEDEIAALGRAMNATLETFVTVDAQARAISEGRVSDPVLERPVPGALGRSIEQMAENLRRYAELSRALSEGDLTTDVQPRSKDDELGTIARTMTESLRALIANVRSVTEQVNVGARALADGAEESAQLAGDVANAVSTITQGIAGQSRATEDVSGAVGDIGEQVRSTVSAVGEARVASDHAGELGHAGQQRVDEVVHAMDRISSSMKEVSASVTELTAQARQVDNMVELVQGIADQTNLLALNASIEAARAGDAGRGFAVVAAEVKALAEQATTSTQQIGELVDRMQEGADRAVVVMAGGQADVTLGSGAVAAAGSAFTEIVDGIEGIAGRIAEVDDAARRIDASARTIESRTTQLVELSTVNGAGIEEVAAASEQTAATAEEIGATAHQLAASVEILREVMSGIRAPEEPALALPEVDLRASVLPGDGAVGGGALRRSGRHRKR